MSGNPRPTAEAIDEDPGFEPQLDLLVVDDDDALREALAGRLEEEGYSVLTASNGKDALQMIATYRPGVVVMDLMMPMLDGSTVLETMKREPVLASIPVLLMTASRRGSESDAPMFHKPLDVDSLLRAIRNCLAPRR